MGEQVYTEFQLAVEGEGLERSAGAGFNLGDQHTPPAKPGKNGFAQQTAIATSAFPVGQEKAR
jgi:hypothetical protein